MKLHPEEVVCLAPVLAATSDAQLIHTLLGEEHARALREMSRSPLRTPGDRS